MFDGIMQISALPYSHFINKTVEKHPLDPQKAVSYAIFRIECDIFTSKYSTCPKTKKSAGAFRPGVKCT
jgi:hypothetical protein